MVLMMNTVNVQIGLNELLNGSNAHVQLSVPQLVEKVLIREEGSLTSTGAVSVSTGKYTGRSPKDKFISAKHPSRIKLTGA